MGISNTIKNARNSIYNVIENFTISKFGQRLICRICYYVEEIILLLT